MMLIWYWNYKTKYKNIILFYATINKWDSFKKRKKKSKHDTIVNGGSNNFFSFHIFIDMNHMMIYQTTGKWHTTRNKRK